LAQYHLHPESKFHNGDYLDSGVTHRRHIRATAVEHIGKEANRWEEQFYLGLDLEAQTEYGLAPDDRERILKVVRQAGKKYGQRKLARASCTSLSEVSAILHSKRKSTLATLAKLHRALPYLDREANDQTKHVHELLDATKDECRRIGSIRQFARQAGVDGANLAHVLSGRRKPSQGMLMKVRRALHGY
jgi:transcriptional regulator with XRE-family HTH domain